MHVNALEDGEATLRHARSAKPRPSTPGYERTCLSSEHGRRWVRLLVSVAECISANLRTCMLYAGCDAIYSESRSDVAKYDAICGARLLLP